MVMLLNTIDGSHCHPHEWTRTQQDEKHIFTLDSLVVKPFSPSSPSTRVFPDKRPDKAFITHHEVLTCKMSFKPRGEGTLKAFQCLIGAEVSGRNTTERHHRLTEYGGVSHYTHMEIMMGRRKLVQSVR
jgi:hypothetical protein